MKVKKKGESPNSQTIAKFTSYDANQQQDLECRPNQTIKSKNDYLNTISVTIDGETIPENDFENIQTREEVVVSKNISRKKFKCKNEDSKPRIKREKSPKGKWSQYEKRYKTSWENDPNLSGWMMRHTNDRGKVVCRFCKCELRAHKTDLYKHLQTKKHQKRSILYDVSEKNNQVDSQPTNLCQKLKTEKLIASDGSCIYLQSETGVLNPQREASRIMVNYSPVDPIEEVIQSDSPVDADPEREISEIANRIGVVLIEDIEKLLRTQKKLMKFFKKSGEVVFSHSNLQQMTRICLGHLTQKYLVEAAVESSRRPVIPPSENEREWSARLSAIEKTLSTAMNETQNLKMTFEGFSYADNDMVISSEPSTSQL